MYVLIMWQYSPVASGPLEVMCTIITWMLCVSSFLAGRSMEHFLWVFLERPTCVQKAVESRDHCAKVSHGFFNTY